MTVTVRGLKKREDIQRVKAAGNRAFRHGFVLQWMVAGEEPGIAVGYTASTKGVGNAVKRNRARRRLKAAFDEVIRLNPSAEGGQRQLVLVAKAQVLDQAYPVLLADVRSAMRDAGLTC